MTVVTTSRVNHSTNSTKQTPLCGGVGPVLSVTGAFTYIYKMNINNILLK